MYITKDDIGNYTFEDYRKVGTTKLSAELLSEGDVVATLEGDYTCAEPSRLAIDAAGNVYPVAESIVRKSYTKVSDQMPPQVAGQIAEAFHNAYERLAPEYGYKSSESPRAEWAEVPEGGRDLMTAVVKQLLDDGVIVLPKY